MRIDSIHPVPSQAGQAVDATRQKNGTVFDSTLQKWLEAAASPEVSADKAVAGFVKNQSESGLHETLLAVDKAEISFKFAATVRNRLLDAYREIMRMGM